ncbi:RHS repeat-associated core domain-containing protein [Methylobacter luteus]|uniref:RHS repeat-associated core domain-containing protein n=1 Tax=Methylobacter luteus TaxID=415 RepID=UPI0003FA3DA1|nr:RHS repeat-associated core domain-containing protein [Methylobacter luteus]
MAVLRPGATTPDIYYIHADTLGTPRQISRPVDNKVVWAWESEAFGASLPDQNPSGLGTFVFNLRFPGQYYDAETGLHYNYFRDYDPRTGRYSQSDPIGLAGGLNTYAYVGGSPVNAIDPDGLNPIVKGAIQCAKDLRACGVVLKKVWDGCKWVWKQVRNEDDIFNSKAPEQTTPGTNKLEGQYINDKGRVEPWEAHYDEYGRQIGRTDYNAGNKAQDIPDTHYHTREYNARFPDGRSTGDHLPGEYLP